MCEFNPFNQILLSLFNVSNPIVFWFVYTV